MSAIRSVGSAELIDHGGEVLPHADVVPVYLGRYWETAAGTAERKWNDAALKNLMTNKGMVGIWKQYGVGAGTTSRSITLGQVNPSRITQDQLEGLVRQAVAQGIFDTRNPQRIFNMVLPPGCVLTTSHGESSAKGMGGFHGSVTIAGREVYFTAIAYSERTASGLNGIDFTGRPRDNITVAESHEIAETITDPDVARANRTGDLSLLGWYDSTTRWGSSEGKGEIADIPVIDAQLAGDRSLRSAWGRSGGFAFQKMWSNEEGRSALAPEDHER